MNRSIRHTFLAATTACGLWLTPVTAQTTATTDPVGAMTVTIPAGSPTVRSLSFLSFPLLAPPQGIQGVSSGDVSLVGADFIEIIGANWSPGQLSFPDLPFFVRFTSGEAKGLTLLVSSSTPNTSIKLFFDESVLEGLTLVELGVASGDSFSIFAADTIRSAFGDESNGITGGSGIDDADMVQMYRDGAWERYFFDNSRSEWVQLRRGFPSVDNVPIAPQSAVLFSRVGNTPLSFTLSGSVANDRLETVVPAGVSFIGTGRPTQTTISDLGLENIPGWKADSEFENSDTVDIYLDGAWNRYWFDGTNWRQFRRGFPVSDDVELSSGMGIVLNRRYTNQTAKFSQELLF